MANASWLTALLTATGTNSPKSFPKSPDALLNKPQAVEKPMSPSQWLMMIKSLTGGNRVKKPKKNKQDKV